MDSYDPRNEQTPRGVSGWVMKLFIKITGADEETLNDCPKEDWDTVRALGELMVFTWIYQAALFAMVGHQLFAAGHFRPDLILIAAFIATFILFIDSYMFFRSGWHLNGIREILRGGLDISGGAQASIKAAISLAVRILLSIGLAELTAVFISLLIFSSDIENR